MFRAVRAPSEPGHGNSLSEFGYHINEKGEFINTTTGEYFDFFHTDSERANDSRRGVFQEYLRTAISVTLKDKHGIEEVFLGGQDGAETFTTRPTGPHVSVLATELSDLRKKQDIIVVIGESTQDCGIWAWRLVQREGGMEEGSLVGLAKKVTARSNNEGQAVSEHVKDISPGIMVLNPGQLLYSPGLKINMTMASWLSRRRPNATCEPYAINKEHNFVPGHEDPARHIYTVLQRVLPQIIAADSRLHIITVGDGSTPTIEVLDAHSGSRLMTQIMGGIPRSIAMIEPRHEHETILSQDAKVFLSAVGKAWVQSEEPKGFKLQLPDGPLLGMPSLEFAPGAEVKLDNLRNSHVTLINDGDHIVATEDGTAMSHALLDTPGLSDVEPGTGKVDSAIRDDLSEASTIIADSPILENLNISKDPLADKENIDPAIDSPPASAIEAPPNTPLGSPAALSLASDAENLDEEKVKEPEDTKVHDIANDDFDEDDPPPLPPAPVSCPTFSAGVFDGVVETVFPAVMDDVFEHIWVYIKQAKEEDAATAAKGTAFPRDGGEY